MRRGFRKIFFIPLIILVIAVFGLVTMLLWNALMPVIFGLPVITYLQALGLLILSKILFGGFGHRGGRGRWKKHCGPFGDKWKNMTPEEREEFMKSRHHGHKEGPAETPVAG